MPCAYSKETLDRTIAFHGHLCPGLLIGVRASELALRELGEPQDGEWTAVTETDMCGVDAVQFLTGCTFGKGNLVHRDYGKMAFTFFDRKSGRGFRAVLKPEVRGGMDQEMGALLGKIAEGRASAEDKTRVEVLRQSLGERFLELALEEMFSVAPLAAPPFRPARILGSLVCEACGEMTMESRTRRLGGKTLCIPCFAKVEQKV